MSRVLLGRSVAFAARAKLSLKGLRDRIAVARKAFVNRLGPLKSHLSNPP